MSTPLELRGVESAKPRLPDLFASVSRSVDPQRSVFLPVGYLTARRTWDVGPAARSAAEGAVAARHEADDNEVLVLELSDGGTLVTSARRLRDTLRRTHPEAVAEDGTLLLEQLRADGAAPRGFLGDAVGGLISRVTSIVVGGGQVEPGSIVADAMKEFGVDQAVLGASWLGTKALMWAIEHRLPRGPGLYRWGGDALADRAVTTAELEALIGDDPKRKPLLIFVHGTASHTLGSFGDLRRGDRDVWASLEGEFGDRIFGFEHRTLSESPIENALQLLAVLPKGAHVHLVSHSRGGLVSDLMCLGDFGGLIPEYEHVFPGVGIADEADAAKVKAELGGAHAEQRILLASLAKELRSKAPVVLRYVRVASPAAGTKLASANFDVFLSGLLTLIGQVPFFFASPFYEAFKRVVIEIAKNRTDAHLVPGIEAMLPDSPMARLLRMAPLRGDTKMAVIAGDIQGGGMLKRLGVLLTDFLLFDNIDNDLVVDTPAMLAGIAPAAAARIKFDRGEEVNHFRYFANRDTRSALRDWLLIDAPADVGAFIGLPAAEEYEAALQAATRASRDTQGAALPVVVVLPGVMGSHLARRAAASAVDRVWFDPLDIASGGLGKIAWKDGDSSVFAEDLFGMCYGKLCKHLATSHRVERFAYDWRQPLDVLGERLGQYLDDLLKSTDQPVRLLAHSMGGLVVRACIHRRRATMDALMARKGARLVMLGTPNQGAYSMVANLIGKGDTLRTLVRLDLKHDMQEVLDIVAGFRGALQLLPKPGFEDQFEGQPGGGQLGWAFDRAETWSGFKNGKKVRDLWFGNGKVGTPSQAVLESASWLWRQDGLKRPALPEAYRDSAIYVFGTARNTPCGLREERGELKLVGTPHGDGTVSWQSGRIDGLDKYYYMPAEHGDLPSTAEYFDAVHELLASGSTAQLSTSPAAVRAIEQPQPVVYDAGPPSIDDDDARQRKLLGASLRNRIPPRPKRRLEVSISAMDLRFIAQPILVGHYEHDPIAGPQSLIDRELLGGDLSERHDLGLYPGPLGSASAVLRQPNDIEVARGSLRGAVVVGLGAYDKPLTMDALTEAVRAGALRYLLQVIDLFGKGDRELSLASLLLGYNSSANLTVGASIEALVRGVVEANARFNEATGLKISIARLNIVELYIDTAISAVYALRYLTGRLASDAQRLGTQLTCRPELTQGEGLRRRLLDTGAGAYWPRLMITDADRNDADCPPECYGPRCPPACYPDPCECEEGSDGSAAPKPPRGLPSRARIADRLRFLYVGQRARAETVVQQRQPGLIEQLVRRQIHSAVWQEDFGRMLFQLMVPHDFKDAARQLDRVVLVVDSYTANLPWELLLADDPMRQDSDKKPLALRTAVVRQLASMTFRRQVRQAVGQTALVIGNPSIENFVQFFPGPRNKPNTPPPLLSGAENEAGAIARVLVNFGYAVEPVIGEDKTARDVLAALYRKAWRVVHISAHGVFDLRHADGRDRSGVLLSDGVLITAAEIEAMEVVPELVFLNCCHLAKVDSAHVRDGNKLAASVARELIQIGVRCVVVAGWAVSDVNAQIFGEAFYEHLLMRGRAFGDAVFEARKAAWEKEPGEITWGAFQAYGDPGWLADPRAGSSRGAGDGLFASPDELLDRLAGLRADLSRRADDQTERERRQHVADVEGMLRRRCPPTWLARPDLQSALGATWRDLGEFERARQAFLNALRADDKDGSVPVRDIEQLANVEARLAERRSAEPAAAGGKSPQAQQTPLELIELALRRLDRLDELAGGTTSERSALRGSALKRWAGVQARGLLAAACSGRPVSEVDMAALGDTLARSATAYAQGEGQPGASFSAYLALNRLALQALMGSPRPDAVTAIELARHCGRVAAQAFAQRVDLWSTLMQAEAVLVEHLLDGGLGAEAEAGEVVRAEVERAYKQTLATITGKPSQLDSVYTQLELLSRFADTLSLQDSPARAWLRRIADRLLLLVRTLQPGRAQRDDRPPPASVPPRSRASGAARRPRAPRAKTGRKA